MAARTGGAAPLSELELRYFTGWKPAAHPRRNAHKKTPETRSGPPGLDSSMNQAIRVVPWRGLVTDRLPLSAKRRASTRAAPGNRAIPYASTGRRAARRFSDCFQTRSSINDSPKNRNNSAEVYNDPRAWQGENFLFLKKVFGSPCAKTRWSDPASLRRG